MFLNASFGHSDKSDSPDKSRVVGLVGVIDQSDRQQLYLELSVCLCDPPPKTIDRNSPKPTGRFVGVKQSKQATP